MPQAKPTANGRFTFKIVMAAKKLAAIFCWKADAQTIFAGVVYPLTKRQTDPGSAVWLADWALLCRTPCGTTERTPYPLGPSLALQEGKGASTPRQIFSRCKKSTCVGLAAG